MLRKVLGENGEKKWLRDLENKRRGKERKGRRGGKTLRGEEEYGKWRREGRIRENE